MKSNGKGDVLLADVIDWGQGYDDSIIELLQAFQKFRDGYYSLVDYGDDWWKVFNQGTDFDKAIKREWDKVESIDMMLIMETIANNMAGTYVRFDKFVDGVVDAYDNGNGLRHKPQESEGEE